MRLHVILSDFRQPTQSTVTAAVGLRKATNAESVAQAIAIIYGLLEEVRAGIKVAEHNTIGVAHLELLSPLEDWLSEINLQANWASEATKLPRYVAPSLLTCHPPLVALQGLHKLETDEVETLRMSVRELADDVEMAAGISETIRRYLLRHLEKMATALDDYDTVGSARLMDVVTNAIGDFATTRPVPTTPTEESLWRRIVVISDDIVKVVKAVGAVGALLAAPNYVEDAFETLRERASCVQVVDEQKALPVGSQGEVGPGESRGSEEEEEPGDS